MATPMPSRDYLSYLRPGTLDDTSWVHAQAHIFTRSKQPWVTFPDGIPVFENIYDRAAVWPEESLARLRACAAAAG